MKKCWFGAAILLVAVVVGAGCAPAAAPAPVAPAPAATPQAAPEDAGWAEVIKAARREGMVVGYSATGLCCDWGQALAAAFKDKYGIKLEILSLAGRQGVEKITVEQQIGKPIADFIQTGVTSGLELYERGLSISIINDLPVMRDRSVFAINPVYSPDGQIVNLAPTISTILVNDKVKPEDYPRSYLDFLDPKWEGQIIMSDPRRGGGSAQMVANHAFYKTVVNNDFWRALMKQKPVLWAGSTAEELRMVARGEYLLSLTGGGTSGAPMIAEGAPMRGDLAMVEGTTYQGYTMQVIKDPPHPNATKFLFNWLFSAEAQDIYAKAGARPPLRKDVPDYTTPRARVKPHRVLERTWEAAIAGDKLLEAAIQEGIFGKK